MDVTGPPAKFNQTFSLTYTNNNTAPNIGWNCVGNPYPSSIDWDAAGWTKTRINNAIYVWNPALQQYSSYVSGIGTNGGSNIIPSSQAFFVQANGAAPVLSLTEIVKSNIDQAFMRQSQTLSAPIFNVTIDIKGNNNRTDQMVVRLDPNASTSFDSLYDAYKFPGGPGTPYIASVMSGNDLSINSIPDLSAVVTIPVRVKVAVTGSYTISLDSISNLPASGCIVLEDALNGTFTNLRNNTTYVFNISDTTVAPRFFLHLSPPLNKQVSGPSCSGYSNGIAIASPFGSGPWSYTWTNSNNVVIRSVSNSTGPDTLANLVPGVYSVTVTDPNSICGNVSDTFTVAGPQPLAVNASFNPVSCSNVNDGAINLSPSGGTPPYAYSWSNGSTTASVTGLPPGNYSLLLTDVNGCTDTASFTLTQPAPFIASFSESNDTAFLSQNNGAIIFTSTSTGATQYTWTFSDTVLIGYNASITHYSSVAGGYTVTFITSNGSCSDTAFGNIVVVNDVLTGDPIASEGGKITVTRENNEIIITLGLEALTPIRIDLFDVSGRAVVQPYETRIEKGSIRMELPSLASGIYLLRITDGKNNYVRKIIF
jgi:hypothetical protein